MVTITQSPCSWGRSTKVNCHVNYVQCVRFIGNVYLANWISQEVVSTHIASGLQLRSSTTLLSIHVKF